MQLNIKSLVEQVQFSSPNPDAFSSMELSFKMLLDSGSPLSCFFVTDSITPAKLHVHPKLPRCCRLAACH